MGKENSVFALDDKLLEGKDSILSVLAVTLLPPALRSGAGA